jgi:hypothetical protein
MSQEKFILGKYTTADSEKAIVYMPPLADVLTMEEYKKNSGVYSFVLTGDGNKTLSQDIGTTIDFSEDV